MANLTRQELKTFFKAGSKVKEQDFVELIDSLLNRKDDCFYGKWVPGTEYCNGAVVIYEKCFYMLDIPGANSDCIPTDTEEEDLNPVSNCLCSIVPPTLDIKNWCKIYQASYDPCCYAPAAEQRPIESGETGPDDSILDLEMVLDAVCELRPVRFELEQDRVKENTCTRYGLEISAVESYFPDIVKEFNGIKAINQSALITILVKSIIELKEKVEMLTESGS